MKRVLVSWSSGKDSAWTLRLLRLQAEEYEVVGLLTTLNQEFDRVAMHAVRRSLVEAQASAVDLPLYTIQLPWPCSNSEYEHRMASFCQQARQLGVEAVAFGDLFLVEVRQYRERQLRDTGLEPLFPLWGLSTTPLAREMVSSGLRARITCVDPRKLDPSFAGREFDEALLADIPEGVDSCGENGEFHSFVYAGPPFRHPLGIRLGEIVERDGFVFADLMPAANQNI